DTLNLVDSIKEEGSVNDLELNIQTKTGETIVGLYHGSVIEIAGRKCLVSIIEDITQRKKEQNEFKERAKNQQLLTSILHILNTPSPDFHGTISHIITEIKQTTGFDAVGIRLQKGDDFPYFSQDGFSDDFLLTENTLAVRDDGGGVCRDKDGNICMECTCGLVISGQADPSNPLFTPDGSCWTNNSLPLLDLPADQDPRLHPRNNCIHEGYSSVALIPIRTDNKIVGLLQLNDKLKNRFTIDLIQFFESMCSSIGIGIIRKQVEEELAKSNLLLTTQQEVGIDGILSIDAEGGILSYNKRFIEMWGITPEVIALKSEEHLVQSVLDKLTNPQEFIKKVKNIYENKGEKYRDEIALIDGRIFDRYSAPMFNDNDQYYGRVLFFRDITEQVKLQNAIKENEQYFRTMWESLQAGVAVIDAETFNIVDVNAAALRILKGKKEDVVGHNCGRYICSSECQNCPVMAQGKEVNNRETVFKDLEGNTIPVLKTVEKIELKGKTYLLENFIEITKLKEAQKRLEESEVRFRDIATSMSDWIWEANNEGIYTYCSENVYDFLGYHTNEMLGKKILDFTSPEDWERIIKVIMEANQTKKPFREVESRRIRKDGSEIIVSASGTPILDKDGNLVGYRGTERDVTEKKRAEENLRQLSQAVEQSPATIVITDTEGLIEYTNPKFSSLTGYTKEEAKGQNPRILKAGDMPAEHYKTLWDTIKAGSDWHGEMHNKKKNEELYWEYASVSPIKDPAGNITHFLAVKEDITERKKLESTLQK
ncbi:MAG: PAS domain S-box protein, partial [archaeon]